MSTKKNVAKAQSATTSGAILTAEQIAECSTLLDRVATIIGSEGPSMTATARLRTAKFRKGGEKYIPTLARLAKSYGLVPKGFSVDTMAAEAQLVMQLAPLEEKIGTVQGLIQDARLRATSSAWGVATLVYSTLKPLGARDGKVKKALEPITALFTKPSKAKGSSAGTEKEQKTQAADATSTPETAPEVAPQAAPTTAPAEK